MKKLLAVSIALNVFLILGFALRGSSVQAEGDGHGGAVPISGDVNMDGRLDVSDGIYILNYVFRGGPMPMPIECPPARLLTTGQTKCYDTQGEIACDSADYPGQDGFYQTGDSTAWRYTDNVDGTVTDNCTGLMWQKATAPGTYTWQNALKYCENLSFADHNDWRMPNIRELQSIIDYGRYDPTGDPIFRSVSDGYWSSTTLFDNPTAGWLVTFYNGVAYATRKAEDNYVRAVRGGL